MDETKIRDLIKEYLEGCSLNVVVYTSVEGHYLWVETKVEIVAPDKTVLMTDSCDSQSNISLD